jgi:hypothetical protein
MSKNKQLLDDLSYLESAAMTLDQLRSLHHWAGRPRAEERVSFNSVRDYFSRGHEMGPNNALFAERLHFVAEVHKRGFSALVELALHTLPGSEARPS